MAKPFGTITIRCNIETRKALYMPSVLNAMRYELSNFEPTEVNVFGLFQVAEDEDVAPYFVVELPDGKCCYAAVEQIQFIEKIEEENE